MSRVILQIIWKGKQYKKNIWLGDWDWSLDASSPFDAVLQ